MTAISPHRGEDQRDQRAAAAPTCDEAARFDLDGLTCRIVCVDGVVPSHEQPSITSRVRQRYVHGEVAHFQIGAHRYVLLVDEADGGEAGSRKDMDIPARLTNRELQIVQLICNGLLTKQVSDRLRISEFTVRSYLKTIYCKLGVRSRGAMVYAYAQSFAKSTPGELSDPEI